MNRKRQATAGQAGRVMTSHSSHGVIELDACQSLVSAHYRRQVGRPLCNDQVEVLKDGNGWSVTQILERNNAFIRADQRQHPRPVAANIEQVLIVTAPWPETTPDLIDRYLVAIHALGMTPLLVINKWELASHPDYAETARPLIEKTNYLEGLGYSLIKTSCKGEPGLDALNQHLQSGASILVGQSGVGKSSIVSGLIPDIDLQTQAVSLATGKGIHTTTGTTAYHLPDGGLLIDSPGVWEYGLWTMRPEDIAYGFREFREPGASCRFANCIHDREPGCGVKAAVADGIIPAERHKAYLRTLALFRN